MANFDFITERIATGGDCECSDDVAAVVAAGITHVIDNRIEWDDASLFARQAPAVVYLHNGADDVGQRQPDWWFDAGVDFALDALASSSAKVLAHCHMGVNRGPSMAFAILLATGHRPLEAFDMVREARPIAHMAYALDALDWWLRRSGATRGGRRARAAPSRRARASQPSRPRLDHPPETDGGSVQLPGDCRRERHDDFAIGLSHLAVTSDNTSAAAPCSGSEERTTR